MHLKSHYVFSPSPKCMRHSDAFKSFHSIRLEPKHHQLMAVSWMDDMRVFDWIPLIEKLWSDASVAEAVFDITLF
jgi:hypothetical protein